MPDPKKASFGCSPSSAIASFNARRTLNAPQPGHQTTSASESYVRGSSLDTNADLLTDCLCDLFWREWPSVILIDSARNADAGLHSQQLGELRRIILLNCDRMPSVEQRISHGFHRHRPKVTESKYTGDGAACTEERCGLATGPN